MAMPAPSGPRIFRVVVPVADVEHAARFYGALLGSPGRRIGEGRHYFDCGGVILACVDALREKDVTHLTPNPDHIYFSVRDLDAVAARARKAGAKMIRLDHALFPGMPAPTPRKESDDAIQTQPWGERSFYCEDPFGNKLCFVDERTTFTGRQAQGG